MFSVIDEIKKIDSKYPQTQMFLKHGAYSLFYYEIPECSKLIVKINIERNKYHSTEDRAIFIPLYKKVYSTQKKILTHMLTQIQTKTLKFHPELKEDPFIVEQLLKSEKFSICVSNEENLRIFAEACLKKAINRTAQELYILKYHPSVYYNHQSSYIGGQFQYRYKHEILIYNKVNAMTDSPHHFSIFANNETTLKDKRAILNILAFFNGTPNFECIDNTYVNQKLDTLYNNFNLLDCLQLRHPNYLNSDTELSIRLLPPTLKNIPHYSIVAFKDMPHEGILDLYHASLKQFEPLPRCVFLYRVFEYAAANHYKTLFTPIDYNPEDALNYYLNLALSYNPNPLYYIHFKKAGAKPAFKNLFTVLKKEVKTILQSWSSVPHLSSKTPGYIIYLTGRNFTAHGASGTRGERNMQYDYDKNYLHINNVNILLELIARYVVELLNPQLKNSVERKLAHYTREYESLLQQTH